MNELLLAASVVVLYGGVILFYRLFGKEGLYSFSILATILANIEVLILVDAYGMEMTLGNILFATTYLVTDILSENHGKKEANKAVMMGIAASAIFVIVSQSWLLYDVSANDWAFPSFRVIFSNTPRLILSSLVVYGITQIGDVWLYHKWWELTTRKMGNSRGGLWIRNNGSTLISQLFNTLLYNFLAFYGIYSMKTLWSIIISCYLIFVVTSILDTPVVYLCRRIHDKTKTDPIVNK